MSLHNLSRPEWLAMRRNYIGASDAPIIMTGQHFGKTPLDLWQEKLGMSEGTQDNSAMAYGRRTEEEARQKYEKYTGNLMFAEMVFHPTKKFMMATLDGLSTNGDTILEIKCPGEKDHNEAKKGKVPEKYWPQLQHQLACLDNNQLHYFSYRNGEGVLVEVEKDPAYLEKLYAEEERFWDMVLRKEAPSSGVQDMTGSALWKQKAERLFRLSEQLKKLKEEEKAEREALISLAGGESAQGEGYKLSLVESKGRVDYKAIPALRGVDLDQYRKPSTTKWMFGVAN